MYVNDGPDLAAVEALLVDALEDMFWYGVLTGAGAVFVALAVLLWIFKPEKSPRDPERGFSEYRAARAARRGVTPGAGH